MNTNLQFTIYDTLAHLIPGAGLLFVLRYFFGFGDSLSDLVFISYLIIFGYLAGSCLNILGLILFHPIYPTDFSSKKKLYSFLLVVDGAIKKLPLLKIKRVDAGIKGKLSKLVKKKTNLNFENDRLSLFNFCDSLVSTMGYPERDNLMSKEGLYRMISTLSLIFVIYSLFFSHFEQKLFMALAGVLLTEISRYGREYYRTIKNQKIYTITYMKLKNVLE